MAFKKSEIVLIPTDGSSCYRVTRIINVYSHGCDVSCGYYCTFYSNENIHKCPATIKKIEK